MTNMWWMWIACSLGPKEPVYVPVQVGDVSLRVVEGSKVRASERKIQVDFPSGRSWFDISWEAGNPYVLAETWASATCEPAAWDEPVQGNTFWARGGLCTIQDRHHWAIVVIRKVGDDQMMTTYVADRDFVQNEHAWAKMFETALTLNAGAQPLPPFDTKAVKKRMREGVDRGLGRSLLPGGGLLSTRIHQALGPVYDDLPVVPHAPLPEPFDRTVYQTESAP